jgi:hypothetical protein
VLCHQLHVQRDIIFNDNLPTEADNTTAVGQIEQKDISDKATMALSSAKSKIVTSAIL